MKPRVVVWCLSTAALAMGCGDVPASASSDLETPDVDCVSCTAGDNNQEPGDSKDIREVQAPNQSRRVWAQPDQLTFYKSGDLEDLKFSPATTIIRNDTTLPVSVYSIAVMDDPNSIFGPNSGSFFQSSTLEDPMTLKPGESLEIVVDFGGSLVQRSAMMKVYTSHPDYAEITILLKGKFFLY